MPTFSLESIFWKKEEQIYKAGPNWNVGSEDESEVNILALKFTPITLLSKGSF